MTTIKQSRVIMACRTYTPRGTCRCSMFAGFLLSVFFSLSLSLCRGQPSPCLTMFHHLICYTSDSSALLQCCVDVFLIFNGLGHMFLSDSTHNVGRRSLEDLLRICGICQPIWQLKSQESCSRRKQTPGPTTSHPVIGLLWGNGKEVEEDVGVENMEVFFRSNDHDRGTSCADRWNSYWQARKTCSRNRNPSGMVEVDNNPRHRPKCNHARRSVLKPGFRENRAA